MIKLILKNPEFEAIKVSGSPEQFRELKKFCGDSIKISYESCMIDDFWLIQLEDSLQHKLVTVPDSAFIIKIENGFTVLDAHDTYEYFEAS